MKKALFWIIAGLLLAVVVPVLLTQLRPGEARRLQGDTLDPARFEEVRFRNQAQGVDLAGLLFRPRQAGPHPAAVIIHGSGTSRRDNRWYLSLAHDLQDNGIAVLLPDKRGSEQSGGDWRRASYPDLASDTVAALEYLAARGDLPLASLGVIGLSQGGVIAPLVPGLYPDLDWLVSMVGSTVTTHEQFVYEETHNLRQMGFLPGVADVLARPTTFAHRRFVSRDFWDAVGDFDPLPHWRALSLPALALFGAEDSNVPSAESAVRLEALDMANLRVIIYAGSGHALQDPPGRGDRLIRHEALDAIVAFIEASTP